MTLKLKGSSDGSVSLSAPADTSPSGTDVTLTLPTSDGDANQYLQTNGSGTLSWSTVSSPSVDIGTSFYYVHDNSGTAGSSSYQNMGDANTVTVSENVGSDYDGTTNKGRYTAPADGLYRFFCLASCNSVTSGLTIIVQYTKNGSAIRSFSNGDATRSFNENGDADSRMNVQTAAEFVVTLNADDYIECQIKYSGSPTNSSQSAHFDRRGVFGGYRLN